MMDIGIFVEIVAVFTYVVKLGVYGSVVLPSAASTSLSEVTTDIRKKGKKIAFYLNMRLEEQSGMTNINKDSRNLKIFHLGPAV